MENIEKMIRCGDPSLGGVMYGCPHCGKLKFVPFATTLGISSLIYAEAFPNEKLPCFIEGCAHAVSFYGAVAKYFVPDNLRTAVTKHTKDELVLQSAFADLEDFHRQPESRKASLQLKTMYVIL